MNVVSDKHTTKNVALDRKKKLTSHCYIESTAKESLDVSHLLSREIFIFIFVFLFLIILYIPEILVASRNKVFH